MLLNKMHKVLQTQAAEEQCRKQDSESLIHIMNTSDRRAPWSRGAQKDNRDPQQGSRRGG